MGAMIDMSEKAFGWNLGQIVKDAREQAGRGRDDVTRMLRSDIGPHALRSYELGNRHVTVWRLVEIAQCLGGATASEMVAEAEIKTPGLTNTPISVTVVQVMNDGTDGFEQVHQWASKRYKDGARVLTLSPDTVREMAAVMGLSHALLSVYLFEVGGKEFASCRHWE